MREQIKAIFLVPADFELLERTWELIKMVIGHQIIHKTLVKPYHKCQIIKENDHLGKTDGRRPSNNLF
jgi:hypothetical protein